MSFCVCNLGLQRRFPHGVASRGIFCSRTLSLRSITTIGYDMDYTLIHYNVHVSDPLCEDSSFIVAGFSGIVVRQKLFG